MDIREFSMDLFSLAGKAAIVTGGNSGLGQGFALALAKAGANLLVPTVTDDGGETRGLVEAEGRRYEEVQIDLTGRGAPRQVIERCIIAYGAIDIVVNSASVRSSGASRRLSSLRSAVSKRPTA